MCVCILYVWCGIIFKCQYVVLVEDVVCGVVFGEICIFYCININCVSQFFQFVGWYIWVFFCYQMVCMFQGFIQQIGQFYCIICVGFEWFVVFIQYYVEYVVFQWYGFWYIVCFMDDCLCLYQVLMLTGVDVIQYVIGMQCFIMIFCIGDISGGVEIVVIFFLNDYVYWFVFFVFKFIKEYNGCFFVFYCQIFGFEICYNFWQYWVVEVFVYYVIMGQCYVEMIVSDLVLCYGDVDQFVLYFVEIFVIVLQFYYVVMCMFGKFFIFVVMFFCIVVEIFKVSQFYFIGVFLLLFFQLCNQYIELSVLVVDVVCVNYFVIEEFQSMYCCVINNGRVQVIDVYFFCYVWCRVVNYNGLFFWCSNIEMIGCQCLLNMFSQECWIKENVDKVWIGDFNFVGDIVKIQMSQYLFC